MHCAPNDGLQVRRAISIQAEEGRSYLKDMLSRRQLQGSVMTNGQIAARVGSVREVVSRALARLQHDGLILLDNRRVTIPDEQLKTMFPALSSK